MKPFRFGAAVPAGATRAEWLALAGRVEDLGYSTLLVADHLVPHAPAPLVALAAVAQTATDIRLGTLVLNNDLRHPVVLAQEAAALDVLSEGRLELGMGAGWAKEEYDHAGIPFEPGATRVERLEEALPILAGLLAGEEVSCSGRHYRVTGHHVEPRPVQRPRPPILVGGSGRRLLSLAAREADIVGIAAAQSRDDGALAADGFTAEATESKVAWVRAQAGDRFPDLELSVLLQGVVVTDDRDAAAERVRERLPELGPVEILASPHLLIGSVGEMVDVLEARRERLGISYCVARGEGAIDALAPVVARLVGS